MQILRTAVISTEAPSTNTIWINKGEARYFNNGKWELVGNDIELPTWETLKGKPELATVATSGSYVDLSNKPNIPAPYKLPIATVATLGGVKVGAKVADISEESELPTVTNTVNALLASLRQAGLLAK